MDWMVRRLSLFCDVMIDPAAVGEPGWVTATSVTYINRYVHNNARNRRWLCSDDGWRRWLLLGSLFSSVLGTGHPKQPQIVIRRTSLLVVIFSAIFLFPVAPPAGPGHPGMIRLCPSVKYPRYYLVSFGV